MGNMWPYLKFTSSTWFAISAAAFILGVGFVSDILVPDIWFQRSGAVLVAFTIFLFIVDGKLRKQIANEIVESNERLMNAQKVLRDFSIENIADETKANALALYSEISKITKMYDLNTEEIRLLTRGRIVLRGRFLKMEGWLLIIGTLVWGFGDMIIGKESCIC